MAVIISHDGDGPLPKVTAADMLEAAGRASRILELQYALRRGRDALALEIDNMSREEVADTLAGAIILIERHDPAPPEE